MVATNDQVQVLLDVDRAMRKHRRRLNQLQERLQPTDAIGIKLRELDSVYAQVIRVAESCIQMAGGSTAGSNSNSSSNSGTQVDPKRIVEASVRLMRWLHTACLAAASGAYTCLAEASASGVSAEACWIGAGVVNVPVSTSNKSGEFVTPQLEREWQIRRRYFEPHCTLRTMMDELGHVMKLLARRLSVPMSKSDPAPLPLEEYKHMIASVDEHLARCRREFPYNPLVSS